MKLKLLHYRKQDFRKVLIIQTLICTNGAFWYDCNMYSYQIIRIFRITNIVTSTWRQLTPFRFSCLRYVCMRYAWILVPAEIHTRQLIKSLIEWAIKISKTLNRHGIDVGMTATFVFSWKITINLYRTLHIFAIFYCESNNTFRNKFQDWFLSEEKFYC